MMSSPSFTVPVQAVASSAYPSSAAAPDAPQTRRARCHLSRRATSYISATSPQYQGQYAAASYSPGVAATRPQPLQQLNMAKSVSYMPPPSANYSFIPPPVGAVAHSAVVTPAPRSFIPPPVVQASFSPPPVLCLSPQVASRQVSSPLLPARVGTAHAAGHGDGVAGSKRAWLEAAENFEMNADFDVPSLRGLRVPLSHVIDMMKAASIGKRTIQALGDKIMLHRILENLGVSQMPANLIIEGPLVNQRELEQCVRTHLCGPGSSDAVVKPSHLSNSSGVLMVNAPLKPHEVHPTIQTIGDHIRQFMCEKAMPTESAALRSLKPGFIVQPKYACCGFEKPLEIRTVTLWGKARVAVWWYGGRPEEGSERNTWIVRRPAHRDALDLGADDWEVIHRHNAFDPNFDRAIELFRQHVREMARTAEMISTAVGAPFLRTDFFVGDSKWGVRLNEVAYGSCIEYLTRDSLGRLADDAPAIAEIIQEGMARCRRRVPPEQLLSKLGVRGNTYEELVIAPQRAVPQMVIPQVPSLHRAPGVRSFSPCAAGGGHSPSPLRVWTRGGC